MRKINWLVLLALVVPVVVVFVPLITGSVVAGDAPFFSVQGLRELLTEPAAWTNRGENFGGVDPRLWIYPLLVLYAGLHALTGLASPLLTNWVFYFPGVVGACVGSWLVAKHFGMKPVGRLFAALIYALNTYFLLVVDGGQAGVVLAYGLFPITFLALTKVQERFSYKSFVVALAWSVLLMVADPRVLLLAFGASLVFGLFRAKAGFKTLFFAGLAVLGLGAYWWYPLLKSGGSDLGLTSSGLQFTSLANGLLLYAPHWPANEFGVVTQPYYYFTFLPLLIFLPVVHGQKLAKPLAGAFLVFVFLTKGANFPFGAIYTWLTNLPFGFAFRDASKFFIPSLLFAGLLVGLAVHDKRRRYAQFGVYALLLLCVWQAVLGKLHFVLSHKTYSSELDNVNETISHPSDFARTAWFPERHPLAYQTAQSPALDARQIVNLAPLAVLNAGSFDSFNFMHQTDFIEWFRVFGIKHLVFSGNQRVVSLSSEEERLWSNLLNLVAESSLTNIGSENLPVYEVGETRPQIYSLPTMLAVVGPQLTIGEYPELTNYAVSYFEDGKLDPKLFNGLAAKSTKIVFNGGDQRDLAMSFLQQYFTDTSLAKTSDWGHFSAGNYLTWKYQLLIRGITTKDFDYGKGIALSSQTGEQMTFDLPIPDKCGEVKCDPSMALEVRALGVEGSKLGIDVGSGKQAFDLATGGRFGWLELPVATTGKKVSVRISNEGGVAVVNTLALVPTSELAAAKSQADTFVTHFGAFQVADLPDEQPANWSEVSSEKFATLQFDVTQNPGNYWIVYNDSYHPLWELAQGNVDHGGFPIYSSVNGFYVDPDWTKTRIIFKGQEYVRWGMYYTAVSALVVAILLIWKYDKKKWK